MGATTKLSELLQKAKAIDASVMLQALRYPLRKAYQQGKFAHVRGAQRTRGSFLRGIAAVLGSKPRTDRDQVAEYAFPGRVLAHQWLSSAKGPQRQQVELTCENAMVRISVLAPDVIRVRASPTGRFSPLFSYAIAKDDAAWPPTPFTVEESEDALTIRTARLQCRVEKPHLALTFLDLDGTVINADAAGIGWENTGLSRRSEKVLCWKRMPPGEHVYGLGQKTSALDKRGLAFQMWNSDPQHYAPGDDPIYSNIPFYAGLHAGRGYGIFFDNSGRGQFDFGAHTPGITRFESECGEMRYYFFYGPQLTTVLDRYTELTGRMAMPPLWALGYHQSRWSYSPEARVREIARQFRERRIPCEAIHLDIDYMDGFRCFTWDPERFPAPGKLIDDLHQDGFKVATIIDPGIKVDPDYWVCKSGLDGPESMFCQYPDGKPFVGPVWPGECHFGDFTSPRVRAWWGELYRPMTDLGVDGFWNDMNEPVVFGRAGETFPDAVQHDWEGYGTDHREAHNVYGAQMARATVEGLRKLRPSVRPLVISRSVWAGSQRYNMHWLGDNESNWAALRNAMQLTMNMGMSGIAFTGPDTGGYDGTPDGELLIRWNQLSAFTPFFRNHTAKWTGDQEPWALGEACERISREFIELRYHLLPYHYTAFWQSAQSGIPMMRPLFLAFQQDPHTPDIDDEFMFGDAFLVAPITEPQHAKRRGAAGPSPSRRVYIPEGRWYDFWDGRLTGEPQITRVSAPIERIPLLVRAGSIVPGWPVMQHTGERPVDRLILHVYPGNGESVLYEDDGQTWAFQEGEYRLTRLTCEMGRTPEGHRTLQIARVTEGRYTPEYERIQVNLHGVTSPPQVLLADGQPIDAIALDGIAFDDGAYEGVAFDGKTRTATFETGLFRDLQVRYTNRE